MKLEREAKLAVDPGFRMPDLSEPGGGMRGVAGDTDRFVSTYHDTDDLRLVRWGASLRYRPAEGWTVKLPRAVDGSVMVRQKHIFEGGPARVPDDAVDLVRGLVRGGMLKPVARLQTVRHRTGITRVAGGQPLADVVLDEVSVLDGHRVVERFREVEIELADDAEDSMMAPILAPLIDAGARPSEPVPKIVRALGMRAAATPDVTAPSADPSWTVAELVRSAVATSSERLIAHDAAVRLGDDPEGVHQARVAVRRLRSDLRSLRSMLDPDWRDELRGELGWLGGELGMVRDLDVLDERLREHAAALLDDDERSVGVLLDRLGVRREAARAELLSTMREPRYVALLDALVESAAGPRVLDDVSDVSAADVMGVVMEAPWGHLKKLCDGLGPRSADGELHEARIRAKRVRYAAEALAPVFGKPARRFARRAEALQAVLGSHQDAVVAIGWLRQQGEGASPRVAFTAGVLAGVETAARDDARQVWPGVWAELRRKRLRFWE